MKEPWKTGSSLRQKLFEKQIKKFKKCIDIKNLMLYT